MLSCFCDDHNTVKHASVMCSMLGVAEEVDPIHALSPNDRLSLEIGRVTRAAVELEHSLRGSYAQLCSTSPAVGLLNKQMHVSNLIADVRLMVPLTFPRGRARDAAFSALSAADTANKARNRVVHDMWMPSDLEKGPNGNWVRLQPGKGDKAFEEYPAYAGYAGTGMPSDIKLDAGKVAEDLIKAAVRVHAIGFASWPWVGLMAGTLSEDRILPHIEIMEGPIELLANGGFRPVRKS